MNKSINFCALALAATLSSSTLAKDFNYSFIEASIGKAEYDDTDFDADEFTLSAQFELGDHFAVGVSYSRAEFDFDIDGTAFGFRVGGFAPIADQTDVFGTITFIDAEIDSFFGTNDDTGNELRAGIRHSLNQDFELAVSVARVDIFDDESNSFSVGGLAQVAPNVSLGATFSRSDDVSAFNIPLRFYF